MLSLVFDKLLKLFIKTDPKKIYPIGYVFFCYQYLKLNEIILLVTFFIKHRNGGCGHKFNKFYKKIWKKNEYKPFIIDSSGEWQEKPERTSGIDIIKLYNKNYYKFLPKGSFLKSRLSQIIIFILNFNVLKKLLLREKPDFLIAHLVVSLPLVLFFFLNSKLN